jgi:hypothetical protein
VVQQSCGSTAVVKRTIAAPLLPVCQEQHIILLLSVYDATLGLPVCPEQHMRRLQVAELNHISHSPVVKGTRAAPAAASVSRRAAGSLSGQPQCGPPGAVRLGEVPSSISPWLPDTCLSLQQHTRGVCKVCACLLSTAHEHVQASDALKHQSFWLPETCLSLRDMTAHTVHVSTYSACLCTQAHVQTSNKRVMLVGLPPFTVGSLKAEHSCCRDSKGITLQASHRPSHKLQVLPVPSLQLLLARASSISLWF